MDSIINQVLKEYGGSDCTELAENIYYFETIDRFYKFSIEIEDDEAIVSVEVNVNQDWQSDKELTYKI